MRIVANNELLPVTNCSPSPPIKNCESAPLKKYPKAGNGYKPIFAHASFGPTAQIFHKPQVMSTFTLFPFSSVPSVVFLALRIKEVFVKVFETKEQKAKQAATM